MFKLRQYQIDCIKTLLQQWHNDANLLAVLATGSGKTVIASTLIKTIVDKKPDFRCLFLVDTNQLIKQTAEKMAVEYGIYNAEIGVKDLSKTLTIASLQSFINAPLSEFDLIIFDEVHDLSINDETSMARRIWDKYKCKTLGLTATPFNRKGLIYGVDNFFKKVHFQKDMRSLTNEGHLAPIVLADSKESYDTSSLRVRNGDFVNSDLIKLVSNDNELSSRVANVISRTVGRSKVVVICVSIDHANDVAKEFERQGCRCGVIHSEKGRGDIADFENGDMKYLASVMMLKKGYDFPALDCIALFRPVRSPSLYVQIVGRAARLHHGKTNGLFLDYGGTVDALGSHLAPVVKGQKPSRMELCPECECFNELGTIDCVYCGFTLKIFPPNQSKRERDLFKNLSPDAHTQWVNVWSVSAKKHVSKAGNECAKITFFTSGAGRIGNIDNYFTRNAGWAAKNFLRDNFCISDTPESLEKFIDIINSNKSMAPRRVMITKDGKYNVIIGRLFQ